VYPSQWQANVGYTKKKGETKDEVKLKRQRIRANLKRTYGVDQEDQQDCILMFHWWRDNVANGDV